MTYIPNTEAPAPSAGIYARGAGIGTKNTPQPVLQGVCFIKILLSEMVQGVLTSNINY
jgi:hypothetical protein